MKKGIIMMFIVVFGVIITVNISGYNIKLPDGAFFGTLQFIGTNDGKEYFVTDADKQPRSNVDSVYEYDNGEYRELFQMSGNVPSLMENEIVYFEKDITSQMYTKIVRYDLETYKKIEVEIDYEILITLDSDNAYFIRYFDDDYIVIYKSYSKTIDGNYIHKDFYYVIDKEENKVTALYDVTDYTNGEYQNLHLNTVLKGGKLIFTTDNILETRNVNILDLDTGIVTTTHEEQFRNLLILDDETCYISINHQRNYHCITIPEENVSNVKEFIKDSSYYAEYLFDGEYFYIRVVDELEIYDIDGNLIQTNSIEGMRDIVLSGKKELMYIESYVEGRIFVKFVFEIITYDIFEDKETFRSKPLNSNTEYKRNVDGGV